ncbi:MAG: CPBP family intramembrane metalloprotease [Clostridiales bacterium]|nr:CPBP family intramembrane metalloprotease [Clostridiales bacterium]
MEESSRDWKKLLLSFWRNRIYPFVCPPKHPNIGLILMAAFGLSFVMQMIWQGLPEDKLFFSKTSLIGYSFVMVFRLLALLLIYVFTVEQFEISEHHTWGRNPGLGAFFMSFLVGVPCMLISVSAHNLFIFAELKMENPIPSQLYYYVTTESSRYGLILILLVTVILPALIEELFFRGLVYGLLPEKWYLRIPIPALLSTLFATNRLEFFTFFAIGLCASFVRYYTDSVLCCSLMRIGMACATLFLSELLPTQDPQTVQNAIDYNRTVLYSSFIALGIGCVMAMVIFGQLFYFHYRQKEEDRVYDSAEGKALSIPTAAHFRLGFFLGILFLILCWAFS